MERKTWELRPHGQDFYTNLKEVPSFKPGGTSWAKCPPKQGNGPVHPAGLCSPSTRPLPSGAYWREVPWKTSPCGCVQVAFSHKPPHTACWDCAAVPITATGGETQGREWASLALALGSAECDSRLSLTYYVTYCVT